MQPKHFHYISKIKIDALAGQIEPKVRWSKVSPKIQGFGLGIDLGLEKDQNVSNTEELVRKTIETVKYLNKKKRIISLKDRTEGVNASNIYHDEDVWYHGLYSFQQYASEKRCLITYVSWKVDKNSVFLLFGSPLNVLGNKEVSHGALYDSTSSQIIGDMLEESITSPFLETLQNRALHDLNEKVFVDINLKDPSEFHLSVQSWMHTKRIRTKVNVFRGTALTVFCHEALSLLPSNKLDILFRIYQTLPVSRSVVPFDVLYLGSPLYTALQ